MKTIRLFFLLLNLFSCLFVSAQVSHGGSPYFLQRNLLRAFAGPAFVEMPAFDVDSVLRDDELNKGNMRGSYQFAHKFYTNIDMKQDAALTVLSDGTKIRQIGIRSAGAYSINLLLKNFEIPEGGKLFVYNADYSYIIGSFDHRNNSPGKMLPLQPVAGESIIVEYAESANAAFEGNFTIAEVNHDYRDFLRVGPQDDSSGFACMPDVLCSDADEKIIRSTVLLIINGVTLCSGTMINNTEDNGTPYLLTAVHCLNTKASFPKDWDYYETNAGSIIAFFNYNRPACGTKMKGTEEMSLATAHPRVILERNDIALLEFQETPPDYYNAYYAGWNVETNGGSIPHTNLHHPLGAVKKYGLTKSTLALTSIPGFAGVFETNSHWKVSWDTGSTHGGSSGSPLFDNNHLIVGGLTAGSSLCNGNKPNGESDYFFALYKGWENSNPDNQLKTYLDPANKKTKQYPGMDPHQTNPLTRLGNAAYNSGDSLIISELVRPDSGFVFGNSNLSTVEFAEEFMVDHQVEILGSYFLIPNTTYANTSGVEVSVYSGTISPETKLQTKHFSPNNNLTESTESFIQFDEPVKVKNKFFISYKITRSATSKFCVYNTKFSDANRPNTAWLKDETRGWVPADAYIHQATKTALAIQVLLRNDNGNGIKSPDISEKYVIRYSRSDRLLTLLNSGEESGSIEIFSIGGQLMEKFRFQPEKTTFTLSEKPKGTIGILRVNSAFFTSTRKIIY